MTGHDGERVHVYESESGGWEVHHDAESPAPFLIVDPGMGNEWQLTAEEAAALYQVIGDALRATKVLCGNCGTVKSPEREHSPNSMGSCFIGVRLPPPSDEDEDYGGSARP